MNKIRNKGRLTVGLLVDWAEVEYQMKIIFGAVDAAKIHDVNIVCIEGGNIHSKRGMDKQRNILYDIGTNDLDGLIILAGSVGYYANQEQMLEFCNRYRPRPIVGIVREIDGCGLVMADNTKGLKDLLVHLIEVHQYRRFAVVGCCQDHPAAMIRVKTIRQTLEDYQIGLRDEMMVTGDFSWSLASGRDAVKTLLDERKVQCDAIIAVNDNLAWGALEELRARKIRVPEDIAVVGFDNFELSAHSSPPLSTVRQPLYEQGARAVEHLLGLIRGSETPRRIIVPTEMVLRESCGCIHQAIRKSVLGKAPDLGNLPKKAFLNDKKHLIEATVRHVKSTVENTGEIALHELVGTMMDALGTAESQKRGEYLDACRRLYRQTQANTEDIIIWQNILSEIRKYVLSFVPDCDTLVELEDMLHQARIIIADMVIEKEKGSYQGALNYNLVLNNISEELLASFSVKQLMEVLAKHLPELGITSAFITRFETGRNVKRKMERQLILAYHKRGRLKNKNNHSRVAEGLVPREIFEDGEQHAMLVTLLNFSKMSFGIMGVELDLRNNSIYGSLRRIVCSSLHSVILNHRIKEHEKRLVAREYSKNLAELKKAMEAIIHTILLTMETRDPYTAGHQNRVADLATAIAREMNLPTEIVEGIRMAGIVHDVGKISVPTEILNKPGQLRFAEFELIKEHPRVAYDILKNLEFPWPIAETILQHHERMNGTGYPQGFKGEEIKLEAKILAVADVIEAMASHRPYRPALGIDKALEEIWEHKGDYYETAVVDACFRLFHEKGYQLINPEEPR